MIDRMEDTERLRSRMRERRRREVFEKAEKEEELEKAIFARFVCLFLAVFGLIKLLESPIPTPATAAPSQKAHFDNIS